MFCGTVNMLFSLTVLYFIGFSFADERNVSTRMSMSDKNEIYRNFFDDIKEVENTTTVKPPAEIIITPNIWIYVVIGVGVLAFIIIAQTICFIIYTRKVKVSRRTIEDIIRSTEKSDDSRDRYSQQPGHPIKMIDNYEMELYESLQEINKINKKPAPPPIETLPRKKNPPPTLEAVRPPLLRERTHSTSSSTGSRSVKLEQIPPKRVPGKHFHNTASIPRSRERMPIQRDTDSGREIKPVANRSRMPLPHEVSQDKPSTLPKRSRNDSPRIGARLLPSLSPTNCIDGDNELMAKLKKRAALAESQTNHTGNTSPPILPPPIRGQPKSLVAAPTLPKPYKNDSDASDEEWTIEPLKPMNLYNV